MTSFEILKKHFGYDAFRDGQETLINSILAGKDVLGIMPTGAGKSMCFQIPALMMDGLTLVVSPLISLMKDQVNALTQSGIAAAFINSSITDGQIYTELQKAKKGEYKLIYIAPERLLAPDFLSFAKSTEISMLTVDEAHCISHWGQDFRPSYAKIPEFISKLKKRPILSAFTATATPKVREDIIKQLELKKPEILVAGFNRENLYFRVEKPKKKFLALIEFLRDKRDRSGIIYCATRATVDRVCEQLKESGFKASRYHAGLSDRERRDNQDNFLYDRIKIMVATNAFGMGIDKSNVSFVVHYNMPKDVESYYQEAGRAGRDGEPADCVLLYNAQDVYTNLRLIENPHNKEHIDKETEEMLIRRNRRRLQDMNVYCATNDCLRAYILKYFGENPPDHCGNCVNCNTEFKTVDITIDAQKVISCVYRMKEKYGVKMVIDVLRGSKREQITRWELDKLSTYNISDKSEKQLQAIINHLIVHNYLIISDDEFPLLKFGQRAMEVLRDKLSVSMKTLKETKEEFSEIKQKPGRRETVKSMDKGLYSVLRELRLTIANEQSVPAFVIFADSTLTDMCMKLPTTKEEFLTVSGVGQVKLERYGERFLKAIRKFLDSNDIPETTLQPPKPFNATSIEITEETVTVSILADRINCVLMESGYKKLSGARINDWLISMGYMTLITINNKNFKCVTDTGIKLGITSEERVARGESVRVNLFGSAAQRLIAENALRILDFK